MKLDIVIEAVRYAPKGTINLVRAYEKRGVAFSDHVLISREALVERLQQGKKCFTGHRKELLAGSFETGKEVLLKQAFIGTGSKSDQDWLDDVPVF